MKLKEVKEIYRDEWVLAEVLKEDKSGEPIELKVITHSKNRDDTYDAMKKVKGKYSYHFYTGKIPKEGYAVALDSKCLIRTACGGANAEWSSTLRIRQKFDNDVKPYN